MPRVRDVMTPDVISVSPELSLRDLVDLLAAEHITGAPVVVGGKVVGIVTADDVLSFLSSQPVVPTTRPTDSEYDFEPVGEWVEDEEAPGAYFFDAWSDAGADAVERLRTVSSPEWDLLAEHVVAEAMSRKVASVGPDADLASAAERMERFGMHRLLVLDRGTLVGILTTSDITRAVARHRV